MSTGNPHEPRSFGSVRGKGGAIACSVNPLRREGTGFGFRSIIEIVNIFLYKKRDSNQIRMPQIASASRIEGGPSIFHFRWKGFGHEKEDLIYRG
jgi:hypothetical protein